MKENLVPAEKRDGRSGVTLSTVILAITIAVVITVIIGGGFSYFSLVQRVRHLENELIAIDSSEETREKRQASRGQCFVCPTGPPGRAGPRGFKGRDGRRGKDGADGPRGPRGRDGVCDCPDSGKQKVTEPYEEVTEPYEEEDDEISYGSTPGDSYSTTTEYEPTKSGNHRGRRPSTRKIRTAPPATESYITTPDESYETTPDGYDTTTEGYDTTTEGYDTTTDGYDTTTEPYESTTTVDPGPIRGNKGYGGDSGPHRRRNRRRG